MSFSSQVKEEVAAYRQKDRPAKLAELLAILEFGCGIGPETEKIELSSENAALVQKADHLLYDLFRYRGKVSYRIKYTREEPSGRILRQTAHILYISHPRRVEDILETLGLYDPSGEARRSLLKTKSCRKAYVQGAFLTSGSINNPAKNYHTEILSEDPRLIGEVGRILEDFGIPSRQLERKRTRQKVTYVLYLKNGEQMVDLLSVMKAHQALMTLENIRIVKDVRNKINRQVNCETANMNKTIEAAQRQIMDIKYLQEKGVLASQSPELKEMARVRLQYAELPLKELGALMEPSVGKSGVNHRLRRLSELAEEIREKEKKHA